ncbi:MAG: DnaJ domain-containing protein [Bacillota bacterium]
MKNYYRILGVGPSAEYKEIKKNYRKLSKKYHPDISDKANAEEKFKLITKAYEVLSSEESRKEYDQKLQRQSKNRSHNNKSSKRRKKQSSFNKQDINDFEERFKDYFGFDPQTKEKINQDDEDSEDLNTDDLFNSFFGVGNKK